MHRIATPLLPLAVNIDTLRPMEGNPRKGDVDSVRRSLEAFGQRKPIVAMADGTITAGHHIHAAAVGLGWTEVAAILLDEDSATAKAFALADNRTSDLGSYDHLALLQQIVSVGDEDLALVEAASYTDEDVRRLREFVEGPVFVDDEDDAVPRGEKVKTCPSCGYEW